MFSKGCSVIPHGDRRCLYGVQSDAALTTEEGVFMVTGKIKGMKCIEIKILRGNFLEAGPTDKAIRELEMKFQRRLHLFELCRDADGRHVETVH